MMLNDKKVFVGHFMSKRERVEQIGDQNKKFKNVFVKNFADLLDDVALQDMFKDIGGVTSAVIMRDPEGTSKGFGFVAFDSHEAAEKAVEEFNQKDLEGRKLCVCRAQKKQERAMELKEKFEKQKMERISRYQGVNLYIKNLEDVVDDERLRKEFSTFGTITSAKVMKDDKGVSKGFGFVCFSSPDEATKAVTEMNGRILVTKPLYVALAQRKEERRAQLASQFMQRVSGFRVPSGAPMASQMFQQQAGGYYIPAIQQPTQRFVAPTPINTLTRPKWQQYNPRQFQQQPAQMYQNGGQAQVRSASPGNRPRSAAPMQTRTINPGQLGGAPRVANQMIRAVATGQRGTIAGGQYKMQGNVRNVNQVQPPSYQQVQPASLDQRIPPLSAGDLSQVSVAEQKQMIGERLFPLVQELQPHLAGKITGMLLEIENAELLHLIDENPMLRAKVEEAVQVLTAHQANQAKEAAVKASQEAMQAAAATSTLPQEQKM